MSCESPPDSVPPEFALTSRAADSCVPAAAARDPFGETLSRRDVAAPVALAGDTVHRLTATSRTGRWERAEYGLVRRYLGLTGLQRSQSATDGGEVLNNRRHSFETLARAASCLTLKQTKSSA